ncbi:MAG TPA: YetF domain-containing protein [Pirellulales bacterium]|jgi:uncharacterized membrane protein YcaP (DUF421 family)|nr:YetF domain-containing protein [Pirellulales bacterium]
MSLEMWWPEISVLEKMFRPLVVYLFLLVGLRLAGKRELAQLNAMDLIVLLTLSNTVQNAIIGPDNSLTGGLIGATTLLVLNYVVVRFLFHHPRFDRLIEGRETVLVQNGKMLRANMGAELITKAELESAAHKQGFPRLSVVDKAVLEPSGSMTFVGKEPSIGETRQAELTTRLDQIAQQLAEIRATLAANK